MPISHHRKRVLNELGQRFREAARDYPGLRHFTVLHDYREFDPTQAVRVAPIMGMYHDLLVRPMCDGRMAGTCHLSGRTSLLSRSVLTELHGMGGVGAVRASVSVLCDKRDANGTPDEQQGRPRAFELLDELARSWVRVVAPEIVDMGGHRYDWPGHILHLLHLTATMLGDGYLHSGCHKLVWDRHSDGVKRKDGRTVPMYEMAPGYVAMVPDGAPVAADGAILEWEFVLSVLSCLHVHVRVLEPSVFDALGYWTRLLLDSEDPRLDFLLRRTLVSLDDIGDVGMPGPRTESGGAEKLGVGESQWAESMLYETLKRGAQTNGQRESTGIETPNRPDTSEESDGGGMDDEANRYARLRNVKHVKRCEKKAYFSFQYAEAKTEQRLEDRPAYDWLEEHGIDVSWEELDDYELPSFDTWARQLRAARRATGEQKYRPRNPPPIGGSIISSKDCDPPRHRE